MGRFFTLGLILFSFSFASAQNDNTQLKDSNPSNPNVVKSEASILLKEESFDFGKIPQGKPVVHLFEVTNNGKIPFTLDNVQASCGCTTPEWEKNKTIGVGDSTTIKVGYNAAAEGPFTKSITVTYNENQSKVITIRGDVWKTPAASAPNNPSTDIKE
jgi:hypothetical protein